MSSRADQKAEARAAREAAEAEAAQTARRRKRLLTFGGALAAAAVLIVAVVLIAGAGEDEKAQSEQLAMFDGIPQDGAWLGDPDAPVVVEEYADLQCPYCKDFALENLEPIVRDFVRSGEVRLRLRMVSILGPDSETAASVFGAAREQDRGWQFAEAFYAEQGIEGTSYVDEEFLRARAKEAGLDVEKAMTDATSPAVTKAVQEDAEAFDAAKLDSTPSFRVGPKDGELRTVVAGDLATEIDAEVKKAAQP